METPTKQMDYMPLVTQDIYECDPVQLELDQYIHNEALAFYSKGCLHYRPGMRLPSRSRSPTPRATPGDNVVPPEIQQRLDLISNTSSLLASAKKTQKRHWYDSKEASLSDSPGLLAIKGKKEEGCLKEQVPIPNPTEQLESKTSIDDIIFETEEEEEPEKCDVLEPHKQQTQDKINKANNTFDERRQKMFLLMNEQNTLETMTVNNPNNLCGDKLQHNTEYHEYMKHYEYSQKQMMMEKRDDEKRMIAIERELKKRQTTSSIPRANNPICTAQRNEEMRQRLEDIYKEKEFLLDEDEEWRDTQDAVKRVRAKLMMESRTPIPTDDVPQIEQEPQAQIEQKPQTQADQEPEAQADQEPEAQTDQEPEAQADEEHEDQEPEAPN